MTAERRAGAVAWTVAIGSVLLTTASVVLWATRSSQPFELEGLLFFSAFVAFPVVGAVIASKIPGHTIGRLFLLIGLTVGATLLADAWALAEPPLPGRAWAAVFAQVGFTAALGPMIFVMLLFPDGSLLSRRWRLVGWIGALAIATLAIGGGLSPELPDYSGVENPIGVEGIQNTLLGEGIGWLFLLIAMVASAASLVLRFRRSRGEERQRLKWLAIAAALLGVGWILNAFAFDQGGIEGRLLKIPLFVAFLFFPVAVGVAILRYRLYDIDVVIKKTLVYGALAIFITVVYVAIVVGLGSLVGSGDEPNVALQVAATAVVAVAFQPVREGVQRFANRLVYGERATPYEVMAGFSHRVAGTLSVRDVLPEMAEAAATGVGASRSRVRLQLQEGERVVTWPDGDAGLERPSIEIPVSFRGEPIGEIAVEKPPGEPLTPAEEHLLEDLASQAGLAMHNVRLTEELETRADELAEQSEQLRRSRERLVTARDVQRRRLERDIREGSQHELNAIGERLREATTLTAGDPDAAGAVLDELGARANSTLEGLRDLARGIFPPLLADRGIVPALEAHVRKVRANAKIEASAAFVGSRFDPETEAAVYFCCLQAVQNVIRHAQNAATLIELELESDGITFAVRDEGPGFDLERVPRGIGLEIMQDRMDALGGELRLQSDPGAGTTVTGRLPARALEEVAG